MSSVAQARSLLRRLGLRPRKGLGQHFLVDDGVLGRIVSAAELNHQDAVVEVGPGLGMLTQELAKAAAQVIAIELDSQLTRALEQILAPLSNVRIINADVLALDPARLMAEYFPLSSQYKVAANLPYYITSPVLRHFLGASHRPGLMVVMVQKEVAQAIVASGGRASLLSLQVQFYGRPRIEGYVAARSFYPAPKVDSAILRIDPYEEPPVTVPDEDGFFRVVTAGFAAPRKQLRNSLALGLGLPPGEVAGLLERVGIDPRRRPETLSLDEWARVWAEFSAIG
ncbi:MAG: 16S rRNA (adenine(1518)-N(6)/adenine(1519)-N(6))-dimethyltransferase RsmA [Dehalococcoidia bacterium]